MFSFTPQQQHSTESCAYGLRVRVYCINRQGKHPRGPRQQCARVDVCTICCLFVCPRRARNAGILLFPENRTHHAPHCMPMFNFKGARAVLYFEFSSYPHFCPKTCYTDHSIVTPKQEEYGADCATLRPTTAARAQVNRKTVAEKLRPTLILFNSFTQLFVTPKIY